MRHYTILHDRLILYWPNGSSTTVYFDQNSGKVYYRYKIDTITNVKHPGVYLGKDFHGTEYWVHNHYQQGGAHFASGREFKRGMPIYVYQEKCSNNRDRVIESALNQIIRGEDYHPVTYNCQTFANQACHNQRKSEAVENVLAGAAFVGLIFAVARILNRK